MNWAGIVILSIYAANIIAGAYKQGKGETETKDKYPLATSIVSTGIMCWLLWAAGAF